MHTDNSSRSWAESQEDANMRKIEASTSSTDLDLIHQYCPMLHITNLISGACHNNFHWRLVVVQGNSKLFSWRREYSPPNQNHPLICRWRFEILMSQVIQRHTSIASIASTIPSSYTLLHSHQSSHPCCPGALFRMTCFSSARLQDLCKSPTVWSP